MPCAVLPWSSLPLVVASQGGLDGCPSTDTIELPSVMYRLSQMTVCCQHVLDQKKQQQRQPGAWGWLAFATQTDRSHSPLWVFLSAAGDY